MNIILFPFVIVVLILFASLLWINLSLINMDPFKMKQLVFL